MHRLRLHLCILGVLTFPALALSQAQPSPSITPTATPNTYDITWSGVTGRLYFIQISTDLVTWVNAPVVELGSGQNIVWAFSSTTSDAFVRLKYSTATNIVSGADGDFDGDGISNIEEVSYYLTDPALSDDTDSDGYLNSDEIVQGTNPNLATSTPFDPQNPPSPNRFVAPFSWWVENKFSTTVEALTALNQQAQLTTLQNRANALADGSYDLPFTSIQAAVDAASAGDVIQVAPGTYLETVDLTARNVKLIGQRGSREETIIQPPNGSAQGILLGAANTGATVVSGITVRNTTGPAIRCNAGAAPVLHNLFLTNNQIGVAAVSSSPVLLGLLCENSFGAAAGDAAISISGAGSVVRASHCTIADNVPLNATAGQVQVSGAGSSLTLVNSIVSSAADRPGGQITLSGGATASVTYSSIRGGFAGMGNLLAADAANPQFDVRAVVGGQRRLLLASPALDRANPAALAGYRYFTRLDADGEARRRAFGLAPLVARPDIGCDEFVSRLEFPRINRLERGQVRTYSEVDEASDVAFLGQLANGNARIAIINDETIERTDGVQFNQITFYEVDRNTGGLLNPSAFAINRNGQFGGMETKDPEGIAFDLATSTLYVTTSQTKVNHYRDCEPTTYDPLVDPPSNDYDPRRCVMLSVPIGAVGSATPLLPTGAAATYYDARDGKWQATVANRRTMDDFANGGSAVSPVGFNSPNGLVATLQAQLQGNAALQASVRNTGVLIAIHTSPKFGNPVNGTTYQPGAGLPYGNTTGLGGPSATAGWVLHLPANQNSADFPYFNLNTLPAAGQQITGYRTAVGEPVVNIAANTTYYFKAWAYSGNGPARVYGRGLEAEAATTLDTPIKVNEIFSTGADWVEFFNPSGAQAQFSGLQIADEGQAFVTIPNVPAVVNIPPRGFYRMAANGNGGLTTTNLPFGLGGSDGVFIRNAAGNGVADDFRYQSGQINPNTVGRVWDGGARTKNYDFGVDNRFECNGSLFRGAGGNHPVSDTAPNHTQAQSPAKFLQATHNHVTQAGVFLHYTNLGEEPAVWRYSPKQQDFHPISAEGLAVRSQNEMVVGLRSPLVNRTTGNAYAFVFSNAGNQFLPAAGWAAPANGLQSVRQINLNGQGIRSIQWCPQLNAGAGAYLIIGGAANGGPLKNETSRQVFSLYQWNNINAQPVRMVADLSPFAVRPEGVNIITLNGNPRIIFVEDRFKAEGYDTQNAVHWPLADLNL